MNPAYEVRRHMNTSSPRHTAESRDQVLVAHAAEMIARTSFSQDHFAHALNRELYRLAPVRAAEKGVPDLLALEKTGDGAAYLTKAGAWLKKVQRWLCGDVELPAWVEEAWVQALDAEYRERCLNELAARHGLIGARAAGTEGCPVTAFGQLVVRLGEVVEHAGAVLADGKIDADDLPLLPEAIAALLAVESRAHEMRRRMENELAAHRGVSPLHVVS
jgi:hypothetical protein